MRNNKYSDLKIVGFPEKLESFRTGEITAPIYVRVKPINLCNHDCFFCLVEGTRVVTANGETAIENIKTGDLVYSPDGTLSRVAQTSKRSTDTTVTITCGSYVLEASPEHPLLTLEGWKNAGGIKPGDRAVVRVRMRPESKSPPWNVEPLRIPTPAKSGSIQGALSTDFITDEAEKSNETTRSSSKNGTIAPWSKDEFQRAALDVPIAHSKTQDAVKCQSHEKPSLCKESFSESKTTGNFNIRNKFQKLDGIEERTSSAHGQLIPLDKSKKSRLQDFEPEKSDRNYAGPVLQQPADIENDGELCPADHSALSSEQMELSRNFFKAHNTAELETTERSEQLCIAGIQLERNLELRPIDSVQINHGNKTVYNFSCLPLEAYEANGFVVHNCVYAQSNRKEIPATEQGLTHIVSQMHEDMNEKDVIPTAKMLEVLDDFKEMGVRAITYSGGGEPLMHKDIVSFMQRTLDYGIDLSIITNGQLLRGDRAKLLAHAKWVRVSVDYTTAEQMALSRRVPLRMFQDIIDNLSGFAQIKQPDCDLAVNYIIHRENYKGLVAFTRLLKECGVMNVRFSPMWTPDFLNYHAPIKDDVANQLREAQELVDDTFSVNSTFDLNASAHSTERAYNRCYFMQTVPVVGADQKVYACHNKAYDHTGCVGSIADKRFKDLWFSAEAKQFFETLNPKHDCCHQCANDMKNKHIMNLLGTSMDNFV